MARARASRLLPELASRSNPRGEPRACVCRVLWFPTRRAGPGRGRAWRSLGAPREPAQGFAAGSAWPGMRRPFPEKETGRNSGNGCMRVWCSACPAGWRRAVLLWAPPRCWQKKIRATVSRGDRELTAPGAARAPGGLWDGHRPQNASVVGKPRGHPKSPPSGRAQKGAAAASTWRAGSRSLAALAAPGRPEEARGVLLPGARPRAWGLGVALSLRAPALLREPRGAQPARARPWRGFFGRSWGVFVR